VFILLFFSSAFFPRETMSGVYATLAGLNPVSYVIEGFRDLVIDGLTWSAVARTVLIPAAASVATLALALRSLRKRVAAR
jgi:ABC-2 type transport system permease protein